VGAQKSVPPAKTISSYAIHLDRNLTDEDQKMVDSFLESSTFPIKKLRKGKVRTIEIRPQVDRLDISGRSRIEMVLVSLEGRAASKPVEILRAVLNLNEEECLAAEFLKTGTETVI